MKLLHIALLLVAVGLAGCERESDRQTSARYADYGQTLMDKAGNICKDGVVYYVTFFDRSMAVIPAYKPDGTLKTCQ